MTTFTRRGGVALALGGVAGALAPRAVLADDFPRSLIRLIVGYPPGGGADLVARIVSPPLHALLGQTCVVENRPGADGRIGADYVVRARADGYTLLVTTEGAMVIAPHTGQHTSYDTLRDLAPISLLTRTQTMVVANPSLHVSTLSELIQLAKEKPGAINYASSGVGGPNHLAAELLQQKAGFKLTHIPFKGTGEAIPAVLSGTVPMMVGYVPALANFVRNKSMVALAVCGSSRASNFPDVPTAAEAGIPEVRMDSWMGAFAPAKTPQPIVAKLRDAMASVLHQPEVAKLLRDNDLEPAGTSPEEFRIFLREEDRKYSGLVQQLGLR